MACESARFRYRALADDGALGDWQDTLGDRRAIAVLVEVTLTDRRWPRMAAAGGGVAAGEPQRSAASDCWCSRDAVAGDATTQRGAALLLVLWLIALLTALVGGFALVGARRALQGGCWRAAWSLRTRRAPGVEYALTRVALTDPRRQWRAGRPPLSLALCRRRRSRCSLIDERRQGRPQPGRRAVACGIAARRRRRPGAGRAAGGGDRRLARHRPADPAGRRRRGSRLRQRRTCPTAPRTRSSKASPNWSRCSGSLRRCTPSSSRT